MAKPSGFLPSIAGFNNPLSGPLPKIVLDTATKAVKDVMDAAVPYKGLLGMKVTPQEQDKATAAAEDFTGNFMGGGSIPNPEGAVSDTTNAAAPAIKGVEDVGNKAVSAVKDTVDTAAAQPGGLQAGFIKGGEEATPKYMPQSELDKFNLPPAKLDMYTPSKVSEIKETLANDVPGETWSEKNVNMKGTMDNLSQQIKDAADKQVPIDDYQKAGEARLKPLVTAGKLTPGEAARAVTSWISRIYDAAKPNLPPVMNTRDANGNVIPFPEQQFPTTIGKDTAVAMHHANNDAVGTFYNTDGTLKANLSPEDEASVALRNASSDVLKKNLPDVHDLIQKQSHLFKADNVVGRLANDEAEASAKLAAQPKPGLFDKVNTVLKNPLAQVGLATVGAGEFARGGQDLGSAVNGGLTIAGEAGSDALNFLPRIGGKQGLQGTQNQQEPSNVQHDQSVSYQFPDVKPESDGSWSLDQKQQPGGGYMTDAQRREQEASLDPNNASDEKKRTIIENNFTQSQKLANDAVGRKGDPVFDFMTGYTPSMTGTNLMLTKGIPNLPTGFVNAWKPGLDIKKYTSDPNNPSNVQSAMSAIQTQNDDFAGQYQRITGKAPGDDMSIKAGDSVGQMRIKLNKEANFLKGWYKHYEDPFLAVSSETGTANAGANQSTVQSAPYTAAPEVTNVGFSHPNAASYLPAIGK